MEPVALKLPNSLESDELLCVPATWKEYVSLVEDTPYTIQFLNGEIIGSQPDVEHECLVATMGYLLGNYYKDLDNYLVLGSNINIAISVGQCDVKADVSVVKCPVDYGVLPIGRPEQTQYTNPEIVVEVLSKSTRKFDLGEKLSYYKLIPSLQHILFVEQTRPYASVYSRTNVPDEWMNHDYRTLENTVRLGDLELPMSAIYRKTVFA